MIASLLLYILKWAVVLSLLYSLYGIALRRETFHRFNRAVLLGILGLSMLLPLCRIQTEHATPVAQHVNRFEGYVEELSNYYYTAPLEFSAETETSSNHTTINAAVSQWNSINVWLRLFILIYAVGLGIAWLSYLKSLISLLLLIARGRRIRVNGLPKWMNVVESKVAITPCSWMQWIILSHGEASDIAIQHEMAHVRFRHSLDLLLAEFTARMLWFLPVGWKLLQDLKDVHEYQVDSYLLQHGIDADAYHELLIEQVTSPNNLSNRSMAVANSLILSSIKKRFTMMYQKRSSRKAALKALYLLPCTLLALTVFAKPEVAAGISSSDTTNNSVSRSYKARQFRNLFEGKPYDTVMINLSKLKIVPNLEKDPNPLAYMTDMEFNDTHTAVYVNGTFIKSTIGYKLTEGDKVNIVKDTQERRTINGIEYTSFINITSPRQITWLTLDDIRRQYGLNPTGKTLYMVDKFFITEDAESYRFDKEHIADCETVKSTEIKALKHLPEFTIIRVFTRIRANSQTMQWQG